ncbi:MAG TPA: hypothetical protein VGP72_22150 [Planctomycetota bacterium]
MSDNNFLARLGARRPGLDSLEPGWRLVEDVLAGRIKRRSADGWYSPYLPKGRLEPAGEYSLRMELTPFFAQTPQLLASRLGALFKTKVQVEIAGDGETGGRGDGGNSEEAGGGRQEAGVARAARRTTEQSATHNRFARFLQEAGRRHTSFEDIAVQAACLAQTHGFCAALIDRDPLPDVILGTKAGTEARPNVSQAEAAALNIGRPYIALYSAPEILDWDYGTDGLLAWVKFGEEELWRPRWDAPAERVRVYRIVDRTHIRVYRVKDQTSRGEREAIVCAEEPVAHGFNSVPVAFLHPFPGPDGIGRSMLLRSAEADIAAARVLSDLVWDLFLLGNPILTLKTGRKDEDLAQLGLGATRYIPLRNGRPGEENPETLEFVQLDPTGIELLFRAHTLFAGQARAASGAEEAAAVPRQQTGIAQAWRFKTGEERVLFMLARALEPFLTRCLELASEALAVQSSSGTHGADRSTLAVRLPESFDVTAPGETLDSAEKLLGLAEQFGQTELAKAALARVEASLGVLPASTREALRREREALSLK